MSLKEALEYGKYGWSVFPLLPRSKAPATSGGFHDAVKDADSIRALWGARTNCNLGIATGDISGFFVLDIDADKGGEESLAELENKYGSLPETLVSNTGGGGKHYLFKIPPNIKIPCTIGKLAKGIDTRGNGGYIAAPPSVHPNGITYAWHGGTANISPAPTWLIKLILELKKDVPKLGTAGQVIGDWTNEDVISMLEVIPPDERDTWINVGMALNEGGWPVTMWDTWSRSSPKYKMGESFRIWRGFKTGGGITMGTLVRTAQDHGWVPKDKPYEELDFSNINGVDLQEFKNNLGKTMPETANMQTEEKLNIGGLIGDTVSWINSTSNKLQPELAALHTIVTLGAIYGRRYALQRLDTRTNLYVVALAESGQGKDNSRIYLPILLKLAGLEQFSGPEMIRSENGLLLELKKQPAFVANIDEFGMYMGAISDPKAPTYYRNISTLLTALFGKSRAIYKDGLTASNPDDRIILYEPHLCIYGTTALSSFTESMRKSSINSGKINRFIVFRTPTPFPLKNKNACHSEPPESLISRWAQFKPEGLERAPDIIEQEKTIVLIGDTEKKLDQLQDYQDSMQQKYLKQGTGDLWVRYRENVIKIAMILAITRDNKKPILIENDIKTGETIANNSLNFMLGFCSDTIYDGEFQKRCSEFMEALVQGATNRTEMLRRMRIKARDLDEIEVAMKEMAKIDYDIKIRPREYILK